MIPTTEVPGSHHSPGRKVAGFGWGLYQQVTAVFATFGLAAIIGHFWHIGWTGFIEVMIGVWSDTVRPAAEWVSHALISVPLGWLGVDFEVPLFARDYVSVAVLLGLSALRVFMKPLTLSEKVNTATGVMGDALREFNLYLALVIVLAIAWPLIVVGMFLFTARAFLERKWRDVAFSLAVLSPLLYLCLLLAVNRWILHRI